MEMTNTIGMVVVYGIRQGKVKPLGFHGVHQGKLKPSGQWQAPSWLDLFFHSCSGME